MSKALYAMALSAKTTRSKLYAEVANENSSRVSIGEYPEIKGMMMK